VRRVDRKLDEWRGGSSWGAGGRQADKPRQTKPGEKSWKFSSLFVSPAMHTIVLRALGPRAARVNFDQLYEAAACDYLEQGEPEDRLNDLKRRAQAAARLSGEVGPPSAEESAARRAREAAPVTTLTDEEKARVKAMFRGSR
jgi:hypothetical protein